MEKSKAINYKELIRKKGITQTMLAKITGINPTALSLQVNKHQLLPKRNRHAFCKELGIKESDLIKDMDAEKKKFLKY